jgi:SAM-dependent methyltransferase
MSWNAEGEAVTWGELAICNKACIEFGIAQLRGEEVRGKAVLEVGASDVNGSLRGHVESLSPARYQGVDLAYGPGVDEVCRAEELIQRYGPDAFDVVLCTEMLEHVRDWRAVVSNLKRAVKPGGILLFTTRSRGFRFHGYPFDFWRYELSDVAYLFSDFETEALVADPSEPGVFFKGRKPLNFKERDLTDYTLYSVMTERRTLEVIGYEILVFRLRYLTRAFSAKVPAPVRRAILPVQIRRRIKRFLRL